MRHWRMCYLADVTRVIFDALALEGFPLDEEQQERWERDCEPQR